MEPLDRPVGPWTVGTGAFRRDLELGSDLTPQVGLLATAVVTEHPMNGDAADDEPGDSVAQDLGHGLLGLIVADLDVGDPGVVVEDLDQVAGVLVSVSMGDRRFSWHRTS